AKDREQIESLRRELERIEAVISDAQKHIERANEVLARQAEIQEAYVRFQAVEAELAKLSETERAWRSLSEELARAKEKASLWQAQKEREIQRLSVEISHAQKQASLLEEVPCHGTALAAACKLLKEARDASGRLDELQKRLGEWKAQENPYEASVAVIERRLEELDYDPEERRRLEEERTNLQPLVSLMPLLEEAQR